LKDKPIWESIGLLFQIGYSQKGIIPMKRTDDLGISIDDLGYYVEGDYMTDEDVTREAIYISERDKNNCRIIVTKDHKINLEVPHSAFGIEDTRVYQFEFNDKNAWEVFLEAMWKGEQYMAVRKKDFIEFFQALRHLHGHHCRQMDAVVGRQELIQKEINEQQENLDKLKSILNHYEEYYQEAYSENKV
jgi:hypothetical protein